MINLMAKAGFTAAYFGVESGDQSILKAMDKNFNLAKSLPEVLEKLKNKDFLDFTELFDLEEQKTGLVVTFLAILELMKESLIEIVQTKAYGIIHVKALLSDNETSTEH